MNKIEVDVAVLGGGVMGLWLADQLRRLEYSVALFETGKLGAGQTGHSHVYIHRGHLYNDAKLLSELGGVWRDWEHYLTETQRGRSVRRFDVEGRFVFFEANTAQDKENLWSGFDLEYEDERVPAWASGAKKCFLTKEACLDATSLTGALMGDGEHTRKIGHLVDITIQSDRVTSVTVEADDGRQLHVKPGFLAVCSGQGNQQVIDRLREDSAVDVDKAFKQGVRYSYMLTVERDTLPWFAGVCPDRGGLFIVSRGSQDGVVWLVSDSKSYPGPNNESDWLGQVLPKLSSANAGLEAEKERIRWGIYEGPKAEATTAGVNQGFGVESFGTTNLAFVWPSKLTLAPKVSDYLISDRIAPVMSSNTRRRPPCSAQPAWRNFSRQPDIADERWTGTPRMDWTSFKKQHTIKAW